MLLEHETDMRPVESSIKLAPLSKVGCASDFEGKVVMQIGQVKTRDFSKFLSKEFDGLWAIQSLVARIKRISTETSQNVGK
ncbi:hypothetical protein J1N35_001710 [Gossypium stocksii]|uniref:Uncharacterized protein n=1 Tax=Gossypium stocksii TaxID=47602 RepID=A0A9D3WIA0_9ROSI|nr:hypothetical protein J1N35_001710 [Gossypium stocksii]